MGIFSEAHKPDDIESHNSLKLSLINISGLLSNFVGCESFFELNFPDIPALCETNLDNSTDWGNLSGKGIFFQLMYLILQFMWRRDLLYWKDSCLSFRLSLLQLVSYFFSSINHIICLCARFEAISSNIDEVFSTNPSANVLVFGDFNFHLRTGKPVDASNCSTVASHP